MEQAQAHQVALEDIAQSFANVRQVLRSAISKGADHSDFDVKDGISLLSLRNETLLDYIHSITLMSCHRLMGHSLLARTPPTESFASSARGPRGTDAGDLVDFAIESRAILEKSKGLESRIKYQIDKLVRLAEDSATPMDADVASDPLAFRPNIRNMLNNPSLEPGRDPVAKTAIVGGGENLEGAGSSGVYRPPKLAPMPYNAEEPSAREKVRRVPAPKELVNLSSLDASMPYSESTSGLGGSSSLTRGSTARARLDAITHYEEDNMTRLLQNKKEEKRRKRDEMDIALGGMGGTDPRSRGSGFEDEFADVLRSVGRSDRGRLGDGYDDLRKDSKKVSAFERSQLRRAADDNDEDFGGHSRSRKKGRFEQEQARMKRKKLGRR